MAKVSYVPYSQDYADLFAFCNISLTVQDYGGNQGWDAALFSAAAIQAQDYLNDNWSDEQADTFETWFDMLDNYSIFYWSTEKPIYG